MRTDVVLDLGWGRLIFGQTFGDLRRIVDEFRREEAGQRDICIYPRDPHVLVGLAPDELFIDPSYTYRLDLHRYRPRAELIRGVFVRTVTSRVEMERINEIYALNGMVAGDADVMWRNHRTRAFTYLVALDDVPPNGERIRVRRTANLHTGGTIEDVTDRLHPEIAAASVRAAAELGIPVTGLDFLVPDVSGPDYVFIEANERPGLANHEPQPVVERFVDLLFPDTRRR